MKKAKFIILIITLFLGAQSYAAESLFINGIASEAALVNTFVRTQGYGNTIESKKSSIPISRVAFAPSNYTMDTMDSNLQDAKKLTISTGIAAASGLVLMGFGAIAFGVSNSLSADTEAEAKEAWFFTGVITGGLGGMTVLISTPIALFSGLSWMIAHRQNKQFASEEAEDEWW